MSNENWYKMQSNGESAQIEITTNIGGFFGLDPEQFVAELNQIEAKDLNLLISSGGGSVFAGNRIYNAILEWKDANQAVVTARVSSLAASMASVIAMAADKVQIYRNSFFMIHEAATETWGNAQDLKRDADLLRKINENAVAAYMRHVNVSEDEVREMVAAETWLDAKQAVEIGLADEIIDEDAPEASFVPSGFRMESIPQAAMAMIQDAGEVTEPEESEEDAEPEAETVEAETNEESEPEAEEATEPNATDESESESTEEKGTDEIEDDSSDAVGDGDSGADATAGDVAEGEEMSLRVDVIGLGAFEEAVRIGDELRAELAKVREESWAEIEALNIQHEEARAEIIQQAESAIAELNEKNFSLQSKLDKLLPAMAASEPQETPFSGDFAAAVEKCGGGPDGYTKARAKYPELWRVHLESQVQNDK